MAALDKGGAAKDELAAFLSKVRRRRRRLSAGT
jgi:hypothetical protein